MKANSRFNIIKEIIETEEVYNKHLAALEEAYAIPLKSNIDQMGSSAFLTPKEHNQIFGELCVIRGLNARLLSELKRWAEEDKSFKKPTHTIGEIFKKFAPFLKVYSAYCNTYDSTTQLLKNLQEKNKEFKTWLNQQKKTKAHGYDLPSYLV